MSEEFHVHGAHDHAVEHQAHGGDNLAGYVAIFTAILASVGAVVSYQGGDTQNQAMLFKNEAVLKKTQASDQWSFYQAKSNKGHLMELAADLAPANKRDHYRAQIEKYENDKKDIKLKAEALELESEHANEKSEHAMHPHHKLAQAMTLIQIAISLASITVLTRKKWLFVVAGCSGCGWPRHVGIGSWCLGIKLAMKEIFYDWGGANAWSGLSVDAGRGLVFAGLGSAAFDFFGGDRPGDNLFANCVVALDAKTGARAWHYQTLRHDLWDHDLPVYPNLVTVTHAGKRVDAVAQVTKTGYVFLFDRETGKPLFDIEERRVPDSDVLGEKASPTQPIPVKPPPFSAQSLDKTNVTDIGAANRASVLARLQAIRGGPAFNPPSLRGTVVIPGFHGGANWSGASFDPTSGLLYVNSNNVPNIITLVESKATDIAKNGPYGIKGYLPFLDHEGYPAIKPPWGVLSAINLNTGEFAWQVPLGEHVELTARGVPRTGTETFGGSIVTAGGLVFIAGTKDERIHAFDKQTGRLLWEFPLPAGGYATPSTYLVDGRQYVVIAAGGAGKLRTKAGDAFVAFRLREDK